LNPAPRGMMLSMSADTVSSSEASRWLDRLERGLRDNEGEALRTWLAIAGNRSCLLSQARFGRSSDVVAVLTRLFPDSPELKTLRKRRHALSVVAVCGCAATIVVAACYAFNGRAPWSFDFQTASKERFVRLMYVTEPKHTLQITLPDGSVMTLNGATEVEVFYWPHSRDVGLRHGEAKFDVLPASGRPFNVRAGERLFEAEGATTFDIRVLEPETLELAVADGGVKAFYQADGSQETPAKARLRANAVLADTTVGPLELAHLEPGYQFPAAFASRAHPPALDFGTQPALD
jgi:transmembrane sensor